MGYASGGSCSNALTALGLHGDLALSTTDHLRWAVDQALAGGCTFGSVDLVNLPSTDCAALAVLNRTQGARDDIGRLWPYGVSPPVAGPPELGRKAATVTRNVRPGGGLQLSAC